MAIFFLKSKKISSDNLNEPGLSLDKLEKYFFITINVLKKHQEKSLKF